MNDIIYRRSAEEQLRDTVTSLKKSRTEEEKLQKIVEDLKEKKNHQKLLLSSNKFDEDEDITELSKHAWVKLLHHSPNRETHRDIQCTECVSIFIRFIFF